jgi:hypothetical protein
MKASHKKITEHINFQNIELEPGQFIFGRIKSSQECGLSQQTVRTCLKSLRCSQNLTIKSTNKYSIITIINWDIYQVSDHETNQQSNRSVTSKQPATNQQLTTNKNDKNDKNDKKTKTLSDFESFWSIYPKKVGKLKALEAWNKQNGTRPPITTIVLKIEESKKSDQWNRDGGQYIPNPATWINQGRWFDECKVEIKKQSKAPTWFDDDAKVDRRI